VRNDGTLWAWGQTRYFGNNSTKTFNLSGLTQVSNDTNWVGFDSLFYFPMVRNRAGELWEPFFSAPDADSPASVTCHLAALTNSTQGRFALGYVGKPYVYQIRADGTLWRKFYPFANWAAEPEGPWHQVGRRSDWRFIHGEAGAIFGLTSDGTFWTWGVDPTLEPVPDFGTKLIIFRERISQFFGGPAPTGPMASGNAMPQYRKDPRPLMKLKP
jgi:hypothetical protein